MAGDKAVTKMKEVPDKLIKSCQEASEGCPVEAIRLED